MERTPELAVEGPRALGDTPDGPGSRGSLRFQLSSGHSVAAVASAPGRGPSASFFTGRPLRAGASQRVGARGVGLLEPGPALGLVGCDPSWTPAWIRWPLGSPLDCLWHPCCVGLFLDSEFSPAGPRVHLYPSAHCPGHHDRFGFL